MLGLLTMAAVGHGEAHAGPPSPVSAETILASPETFEGQMVTIRGTVARVQRAVFPNGRRYYLVSVHQDGATLAVFSWSRPAVQEGDRVEATGIFHVWRYNLHLMIDSSKIRRLGP